MILLNLQKKIKVKETNFIFGIRAVIEAINAGKTLEKVMIKRGLDNELSSELYDILRENQIPYQLVPVQKIEKFTKKNHQGVLGFISPVHFYEVEEIVTRIYEEGKNPLILILDEITDVRNFGAIVRTAECSGVHAILVPEKGAAQINADAMKTSAGALNFVPICRSKNLVKSIKNLKQNGLKIFIASERAEKFYFEENFKEPMALVMGAEDKGVSIELRALEDSSVKIPIVGQIKSLNVSVAAGILLYEALKQRT